MRASVFAFVMALVPLAAHAADPVHRLSLGDAGRRDKDVVLVLDAGIDTATGETVGPDDLAARLDKTRLVPARGIAHQRGVASCAAAGPAGTGAARSSHPHRPRDVSLHRADVAGCVERRPLDRDRVRRQGALVRTWGYHWGYYRDVLLFARAQAIQIFAINAPRELVAAVRKTGIAGLSPEQAKRMPPRVDTESADHLALFKAQVGGGDALHGGMTDETWKGMQAAQATWDAAMAWNAVQALRGATDANTIMVVLVGSGHVAYGLGIERQARAWFDGAVASVIAVPMADDTGPTSPVRASYANFVWGVARELASAWPSLGLSTRAGDGGRRAIIDVEKDGPAAPAGLKVGDIILTIDDVPIDSREALARQVASYNWGDVSRVTITRGAEQLTVNVPLRRTK